MGQDLYRAGFDGRTAIVFDGGGRVAGAIAERLAAAGLRVIVAGKSGIAHDENDAASWQALLSAAGNVNFVVIAPAADVPGGLSEVAPAAFQAMEAAHIVRPWLIFQRMLPVLAKNDPAAFALIISGNGSATARGNVADSAAFGALKSMFKSVVLECGESMPSVRVNAVIADPRTPSSDVGDAVLHLLSPDARFMTGAELTLGAP